MESLRSRRFSTSQRKILAWSQWPCLHSTLSRGWWSNTFSAPAVLGRILLSVFDLPDQLPVAILALRRRDTLRRSFTRQIPAEAASSSVLLASFNILALFGERHPGGAGQEVCCLAGRLFVQRAVSFRAPSGTAKEAAAKPPTGGAATSGDTHKASAFGSKGVAGPSSASQGKGRALAQSLSRLLSFLLRE